MSDLDSYCFTKRKGHLIPSDIHAEEFLAGIGEDKEVLVTIRRPRSPQHHRWFFAMLRLVIENTEDRWHSEETLLDDLKLAVGHVEKRINALTGEMVFRPKSISFASMGQDPFQRFVKRCTYVIHRSTGIDPELLMQETNEAQQRIGHGD